MTLASSAQIRRCAAFDRGDSAALAGIWRRAWASANPDAAALEPIAHWHQRVQTEFGPPCEVPLIERDGQVLAFMLLHPIRRYVAQLFVDDHRQGQGLGRLLLDEACRRLPLGWRLHVATSNLDARRFYDRYGLAPGAVDWHPTTGQERVAYHWRPDAS